MATGPSPTETRHLRTLFELGAVGTLTDGQLLERFATRGGDAAELAFAALVERHGSMVLRVARSVLGDDPSAHDAFQATFLILARKARGLWVRDSLGPWLHAVAFRVASRARAAEGRRKARERSAARPESIEVATSDEADLARAIHEEIERLPQPYRAAIVTCHLEGLTQIDAARSLAWPLGTLQSRLARGRKRLRDRLQRRGLAPSLASLAGKLASPPDALIASTARASAALQGGQSIAGMIAPTVLAMIDATSKGMLMTKLKFGAASLLILGGLVASTAGLGPARAVSTADEPAQVPKAEPASTPPAEPKTPARPKLGVFLGEWDETSRRMKREIADLKRAGYPVQVIDLDQSPKVAERFRVHTIPTTILLDSSGLDEVARLEGFQTKAQLAEFYDGARPEPGRSNTAPDDEPANLNDLTNPKPWETVVRIKMHLSAEEWGFGSGTIIASSAEESIILTSAHIFRVKGPDQPSPKEFRVPISVDLFGGQFVWPPGTRAKLACSRKDIPGEAIDYDFTDDVGLIRIRPGRKLPASRVVPTWWKPQKNMKMYTVGCSHGDDATAWDTTILDPRVALSNTATKQVFATIKCQFKPKEGRSGGGLYTTDGYLAGVCLFAQPNENVGHYATPEAIRKLLDRQGLAKIAGSEEVDIHGFKYPAPSGLLVPRRSPADRPTNEPAPAKPVSEQDRRIEALERKLDLLTETIKALKGETPRIEGSFPGTADPLKPRR